MNVKLFKLKTGFELRPSARARSVSFKDLFQL